MTWADRLLRFATGDRRREVVDQLLGFHRATAALAHALHAATGQAPNTGAESELGPLATAADELAAAVTRALQERQASPTTLPTPALNGASRNHWARLVAILDTARELRGQVLRHTPRLLELDPSLTELLGELTAGLTAQLAGLRALIARADPQALD